jgi:mono/diheme cytochrome c family protein
MKKFVVALLVLFAGGASSFTPLARVGAPLRSLKRSAHTDKAAAAAAAAAILLSAAQPAYAADAGAGEGVFSGNCAACHAGGNNVIQAEKTLRKEALVQYLSGGFKEASIVTQVRGTKKTNE